MIDRHNQRVRESTCVRKRESVCEKEIDKKYGCERNREREKITAYVWEKER